MSGSQEVKREFGFLWRIIAVFMSILGVISLIKKIFDQGDGLIIGLVATIVLTLGLTIFYSIKLKAALNQSILFGVCLGFLLSSITAFVFDLSCKNTVGAISIPLVLVLCGMWIYTGFVNEEIK
jgi:ABC-type Mn2+/Zn2+ transport system permease subunit